MITVNFDPVIFSVGPLQVRWYGLMYVVGFLIGQQLLLWLSRKKIFQLPEEKVDHFVTLLILFMLVGARVTYMLIYGLSSLKANFFSLFYVWEGGLSFHGAIIGFIACAYFISRKYKISMLNIVDALALAGTPGLFFGRIGNFINGELFGRVTDVPWAMIFPMGGPMPRHPSQLYEAILEGPVLFTILWFLKLKVKKQGTITSLFFIGYGLLRFVVEYFREPDAHMGLYFGGLFSMGQILCLLMVIFGLLFHFLYLRKQENITRPTI